MIDLDAIEARTNAASEGPWYEEDCEWWRGAGKEQNNGN